MPLLKLIKNINFNILNNLLDRKTAIEGCYAALRAFVGINCLKNYNNLK